MEIKIIKEVENSIKQVRSTFNLLANIKNSQMTRTILRKYLDYLEDEDCMRYTKPEQAKTLVKKEMMKLVPENFQISLLPAFFNHTDADRIGTVIRDAARDFLLEPKKGVMFSIAAKIYPYASQINSIRIILVKFYAFGGAENSDDANDREKSKNSRSRSGKSRSGGKSRMRSRAALS